MDKNSIFDNMEEDAWKTLFTIFDQTTDRKIPMSWKSELQSLTLLAQILNFNFKENHIFHFYLSKV